MNNRAIKRILILTVAFLLLSGLIFSTTSVCVLAEETEQGDSQAEEIEPETGESGSKPEESEPEPGETESEPDESDPDTGETESKPEKTDSEAGETDSKPTDKDPKTEQSNSGTENIGYIPEESYWEPPAFAPIIATSAPTTKKKDLKVPWIKELDKLKESKTITPIGGMHLSDELNTLLTDEIKQIESYGYQLGFVMIDIKSGKGIAFNPNQKFYSASSVKGLYIAAMTWFYPESLQLNYGTISDVLIYSYNEGYEALWYAYGSYCMEQWAKMAGVKDVDWVTQMYTDYSAKNLAKLWLLNNSYFEGNATGKELAKLYETPQTSRIRAVLGDKYKIRSKAGWIPVSYDCPTFDSGGIVYAKGAPYVIAFVSDIPEGNMKSADVIFELLDKVHQKIMKEQPAQNSQQSKEMRL